MKQVSRALKAKRTFLNPLYKDIVRVLELPEETGGRYALGELEVAPGGGNGPHIHYTFTETFTSVRGVLGVMCDGKKLFLHPGESFTVPLRTPHYFFNEGSENVICRVKLAPGPDGFIKGIAIAYGLATDGKTNNKGVPNSMVHLALIVTLTDSSPAGPLGLLMPLFKLIAWRARKNGIEKALLEKYYYE